ncbi:hypothetical protein GJJ64_11740 [Pedobacter sp. HX-22-1]|uniref:PKD domain-containing protein n=2 Tax=Pedobacter puniceum TaxID=2666136 RepID=A0A7K0FQW9_9SPHI|nr:hypothetical protein [Pedobacter puniceum]
MVEMTSLNKLGDEYYFGERVLMWASTEGELDGMTYEWKTTGGSFDGFRTQNRFENVWIAPTTPGEYVVTATAKNGSSTSTRSTNMRVTRYFFDEFQNATFMFRGQGWLQSNLLNSNSGSDFIPIVSNSSTPELSTVDISNASTSAPNMRRLLNLAELKAPFSVKTKLGWKNFFRTGQPITISMFFVQPTRNTNRPHIREIRWTFNPNAATGNNFQIRYEIFTPATGVATFSGNTGVFPSPEPLINPSAGFTANSGRNAIFTLANGQQKAFTFSLTSDFTFIAHVDGVEWFRSNGIKDWITKAKAQWPDFEDPIGREFRIGIPARATANETATTVAVNSVYINNDGTILNTP